MDTSRILHEGHAPTPFTAEQIRTHCPDGLRVTLAVESPEGTTFHTDTFRDGDREGVTLESCPSDAQGTPTGPARTTRVTWLDLQEHASFPAEQTAVGEETITGPLGILPCLRYDVRLAAGPVTFWFAVGHPGMPVRFEGQGSVTEMVDRVLLPEASAAPPE
ncbi:hypothetical protein MWU75_00980 [Ornithinimicrobium sp. F0845]|uniref:hypothetical protein n=1 Tax=Ornithinimicrobium sp. F0845 TaxID=2926412 RepID=UPI001FF64833|nr:hypothetical protein [Ornithinimicrobium sp. F0845]MCK0110717.1 hypothetical protein [Ornithinimicrobium sp. F0845]